METKLKTPKTHPDHEVVGHHFAGHSYSTNQVEVYFCDSFDPCQGYWLTNVTNSADRTNVSVRAIGATFMEAIDKGDHWWVGRWCKRYPKAPGKSSVSLKPMKKFESIADYL